MSTKCVQPAAGEPLLFPIIFVITSLVASGVLVLMASTYNGAQNYNVSALYTHNVAFVLYLLFITYGSMRMMKYEVVQGLVSHTCSLYLFPSPFFFSFCHEHAMIVSVCTYISVRFLLKYEVDQGLVTSHFYCYYY